ncbi:MAG: alpha/beta hydrolase [Bacteroidales bacterium]|nr:alpha/beta hydrolase [Bacteroidales bacterium]
MTFTIHFAENSWKGAALGAVLAMLFFLIAIGIYIKTGISPIVDVLIIIVLIGVVIGVTGYFTKRFFPIIQKLNPLFVAAFVSSFVVAGLIPGSFFSRPFILFEMICGAMVGYAIARGIKKMGSLILILLVLIGNFSVFYFFVFEGFDNTIAINEDLSKTTLSVLTVDDPSRNGTFEVNELFYGSGNDKNRPEFGKEVDILTKSVDATPFFDQTLGISNHIRKIYWGFDSKNYPINGRVWYPIGKGTFPLVLIVHGNHNMDDYSDPGYKYLGELLASRGYIVVSVDENFLNGNWMGDFYDKEIFTRAWLLLKHLENWREWNNTKGNIFSDMVDMDNIALIGHSRGGAAVSTAAAINKLNKYHLDANQIFDFQFSIKGIVQIAPNDPYTPQNNVPLELENVNYMLLHGGYDQDMYWTAGNRVYNRAVFTDGDYHFKTALYIYRANHGQFNTVWGRKDRTTPFAWYLNTKPIMNGEDQRQIAKLYISAFLESTLKEKNEYIPLFRDYRLAGQVLPEDYYINQFEDSKFKFIADFQEDFDVNTATAKGCTIEGVNLKKWSENALPFRDDWGSSQQSCGVYLGWEKQDTVACGEAQYTIHIGDSTLLNNSFKNMVFAVCNNMDDIDTVDFTIELSTPDVCVRKVLSDFKTLTPPLITKLTKSNFLLKLGQGKPVERVLQYIEIPLDELEKENEDFRATEIVAISFIFNKTDKGEVFFDKIGLN